MPRAGSPMPPRRGRGRPRSRRVRAIIAGPTRVRWQAPPSGARRRPGSRDREIPASFDALDKDLDLAAAGKPDFPGLVVRDAEIEEPRPAVADDFKRLSDDGTLDAAARDRADEGALIGDGEL